MDGRAAFVNAVYYPSWRVYKDIPPSSLPLSKISTIFYAFAIPNEDGTLKCLDEYADTQIPVDAELGCLNALARVKRDNPHLRTVLSIGGGSGSATFAVLAATPGGRAAFARDARAWVERYSFDGIDIDWEHPTTPEQGRQHLALLQACRAELPAPRYLLATALPVDPAVLGVLDVRGLAAVVDHVNLMCYDFTGPWSAVAGHHAQLFASAAEAAAVGWQAPPPRGPSGHSRHHHPQLATSAQTGLRHLIVHGGMPPQRILLGIPAYARVFPSAEQPGDAFRQDSAAEEEEETGDDDGDAGGLEIDYGDLPAETRRDAHVDTTRAAAWYNAPSRGGRAASVSLDVPATVRIKAAFVRQFGLGGLFYWTGAGDGEGADSLVAAGFDGLHG